MVKIKCNLGDKGIYSIGFLIYLMESHHILYYVVCGIAGTKKIKLWYLEINYWFGRSYILDFASTFCESIKNWYV